VQSRLFHSFVSCVSHVGFGASESSCPNFAGPPGPVWRMKKCWDHRIRYDFVQTPESEQGKDQPWPAVRYRVRLAKGRVSLWQLHCQVAHGTQHVTCTSFMRHRFYGLYSAFVLIFDRFEGFAPSFFDLKLPRSCGGTPKRPQLWEDPPVWVEQGCALSCLTARNSQQNPAHANCYWRAIAGLWANDRSDGREKAEPGTFAPHGGRVCTSFFVSRLCTWKLFKCILCRETLQISRKQTTYQILVPPD
jgi:hypothetical protein